jgi:hypothetical protein
MAQQVGFPEALRSRLLRSDQSALTDVDGFLCCLRMDDERRQHVLCWLDRVMRSPRDARRLEEIDDFGRFFVALGRRHQRSRRRREMLRALRDAAFARERGPLALRRGLNEVEQAELVGLVRERVHRRYGFDAEVFVHFVFRGATYDAIATELESRYGRIDPARLRRCVATVREDLRSSLAWYMSLGPSDFAMNTAGGAR